MRLHCLEVVPPDLDHGVPAGVFARCVRSGVVLDVASEAGKLLDEGAVHLAQVPSELFGGEVGSAVEHGDELEHPPIMCIRSQPCIVWSASK